MFRWLKRTEKQQPVVIVIHGAQMRQGSEVAGELLYQMKRANRQGRVS